MKPVKELHLQNFAEQKKKKNNKREKARQTEDRNFRRKYTD
mgnify:CR=1 FL=1